MERQTNAKQEKENRTMEEQTMEAKLNSIIDEVCDYFGVTREQLTSRPNTSTELVTMRHIAIYLCTEYTSNQMELIGELLGYKDHASVIHGRLKVKRNLEDNECLRDIVDSLRAKIG